MRTLRKDPDEEVFEGFDWSGRLETGETLNSSTWEVEGGLTGANATYTDTDTQIELTGGTAGTQYLVTNRVGTTDGAVYQRSFKVMVANR